MLGFIDSPIQILVVVVVLLIVFGPQKLPEMLNQLGRAIREFKKTTSDLSSSLNLDDRYEPHYDPPRYDSYGNHLYNDATTATVPEEDLHQLAAPVSEPVEPRGDFAASALADMAGDYGVESVHPTAVEREADAAIAPPAVNEVTIRPAQGSVSRPV